MWHSWLPLLALSLGLVSEALGDDTFCYATGNCYTIHTTNVNFEKANMTCGVKGFLASMKSQQEKEEIANLITRDQRNISFFWLGLYLPGYVSTHKPLYGFVWLSGGNASEISDWNSIPKLASNRRKCVILESRRNISNIRPSAKTLVWKDFRCDRNFPFICRSSESKHMFTTTKDMEEVTHSSSYQTRTPTSLTDQYTTQTSITSQHTKISSSTLQVNVPCGTSWRNVTSACTMTISYVCNVTHCSCGNMNDSRAVYNHRGCKVFTKSSCLQKCIKSMNISCPCSDHHFPCEGEKCTTDIPGSPGSTGSPNTSLHSASSTSAPPSEDDNLLDRLIIPLILGLVAFGILVMLVWGGVQMCIRKRKPKRRKSIAPALPEGSDTDSTDHSSSEEDEDDEDGEGESQDRAEDP